MNNKKNFPYCRGRGSVESDRDECSLSLDRHDREIHFTTLQTTRYTSLPYGHTTSLLPGDITTTFPTLLDTLHFFTYYTSTLHTLLDTLLPYRHTTSLLPTHL